MTVASMPCIMKLWICTYVSHIRTHVPFGELLLQDKCPHERTHNARYAVLHPIMTQGIELL